MQRLEVSGAVQPIYGSLGVKRLSTHCQLCVVSGFRREVDENCALLGCYAASSGNFLPTFRDEILDPCNR